MARTLKILSVTRDAALREAVEKQVDALEYAEHEVLAGGIRVSPQSLRSTDADILLVDLTVEDDPEQALRWIELVKVQAPFVKVFVCSPQMSSELIMAAMRAGAREFLGKPFVEDDFVSAVKKVYGQKSQTGDGGPGPGRLITLFSIKGGLGVSTIAVNLGVALSQVSEQEPAVVDLDLQGGNAASLLDMSPRYSIIDACADGDAIDETSLQSCMTYHDAGIFLLAEPKSLRDSSRVTSVHVAQILNRLRSMYPFVVADTPPSFDSRTRAAFEASDLIIVVMVANIPSIRATQKTLVEFGARGYGPDKVKVLVNRTDRKDSIDVNDIQKALDYPVSWTVPNDYRTVIESINAGTPLTNGRRLSKVGKSIVKLALQIRETAPVAL